LRIFSCASERETGRRGESSLRRAFAPAASFKKSDATSKRRDLFARGLLLELVLLLGNLQVEVVVVDGSVAAWLLALGRQPRPVEGFGLSLTGVGCRV